MSRKNERVTIRYCERALDFTGTDLFYLDGQRQRIVNIGKRYADAVKRARKEIPEAEVEGTVAAFYRPEIKIKGSTENIKKALNIIFDVVGIPPETEIEVPTYFFNENSKYMEVRLEDMGQPKG